VKEWQRVALGGVEVEAMPGAHVELLHTHAYESATHIRRFYAQALAEIRLVPRSNSFASAAIGSGTGT
jgi:hypothetical protein